MKRRSLLPNAVSIPASILLWFEVLGKIAAFIAIAVLVYISINLD